MYKENFFAILFLPLENLSERKSAAHVILDYHATTPPSIASGGKMRKGKKIHSSSYSSLWYVIFQRKSGMWRGKREAQLCIWAFFDCADK